MIVRVQINETLNVPDHYYGQDGLFIDLPTDFDLRFTKKLSELTELDKIKIDGILGFTIPLTEKNYKIFIGKTSPLLVDFSTDPLIVTVWVGSRPLNQVALYPLNFRHDGIEVELRASKDHWALGAKNKYLNTLDIGVFTVSPAAVKSNYENKNQYDEATDLGVYFPPIFYGKWTQNNKVSVNDIRPLYHAAMILKKGYCEIGWNFVAPVLDTDVGKQIVTYILGEDFANKEQLIREKQFKSRLSSSLNLYGLGGEELPNEDNIVFDDELIDIGNSYDNTTGIYQQGNFSGRFIFDSNIFYRFDNAFLDNTNSFLSFFIIKRDVDGNETILDEIQIAAKKASEATDIVLIAEGLFKPEDSVFVRYRFNGDDIKIIRINNAVFYNEVDHIILGTGDVLYLNEMIGSDYTLLNFTKGMAHFFNWKFITDFGSKTVYALTPFDVTIWNDVSIEGFYGVNSQVIDISDIMAIESEEVTLPDTKGSRYLRLQFKDTSDGYIEDLNLPELNPLYSKTIDLGSGFEDEEVKPLANPFFEPTSNAFNTKLNEDRLGMYMPYMLDNNKDEETGRYELSFKIAPRILLAKGMQTVPEVLQDGTEVQGSWTFENYSEQDDFPLVYQMYDENITNITFQERLIYGSDEYEGYTLFWARWVAESFKNRQVGVLAHLKLRDYFNFSLRDYYLIRFFGKSLMGRVSEIQDFSINQNLSTPLTLMPIRVGIETCFEEDIICENYPEIIITENAPCFEFSIDETNSTGTIDTVVWRYRYLDDSEYTDAVGDQLCSPVRKFEVIAYIAYQENCPDIVLRRIYDPCGNSPQIVILEELNQDGEVVITLSVIGINSPATVTINWEFDGGGTNVYTDPFILPIDVGTAGELEVTADIDYTDACEDQIITRTTIITREPWGFQEEDRWNVWYDEHFTGQTIDLPVDDGGGTEENYGYLPNPSEVTRKQVEVRAKVIVNGRDLHFNASATRTSQYNIEVSDGVNRITFPRTLQDSEVKVIWNRVGNTVFFDTLPPP